MPAISAMPPALSVIGPKASIATTMPVIESIDIAATAMPKRPPSQLAARMAATMTTIGHAVDFMETARPAMMLVPCPVVEALAMSRTGGYFVEV